MEDMVLYRKILAEYYAEFGGLDDRLDGTVIVKDVCCRAICEIREILMDSTLEDSECFQKIEEIVCVLEKMGLDAGNRHDFG